MPAVITDQFRILNASNFIDTVTGIGASDPINSFYVTLGLPNAEAVGFGRTSNFNDVPPAPIDNINTNNHIGDTTLFGKRVTGKNVRRLIRRVDWTQGTRYEMYRHDYSINSRSPITKSARLYDANYYVMNENFNVYVCIDNGSTGINTTGNASQDQPTFTDLEPSKAGNSGDGYVWKYLFTVSPSDIIKFDSTEFITVPNNWGSSEDSQIRAVRENGNSSINLNQIKHVYIDRAGADYANGLSQEVDIIGDGTGAKARVDVVNGTITDVTVSSGGSGYSYGIVDLGTLSSGVTTSTDRAKLIPIIPPKLGHGSDIYTELGTDKVIIYARFDDSTKDFPIDTKFSQVGIVKNPTKVGTSVTYTDNTFSSLQAIKFDTISGKPKVGEEIRQVLIQSPNAGKQASAYVASFDSETKVLKYFRDRSLNFNRTFLSHEDYAGISTAGRIYNFESIIGSNDIKGQETSFSGAISRNFSGITTNPDGNKLINLGVNFISGLSDTEINKGSGETIYLDNRPTIVRNPRQKEDIKIILEF